jgi:hypothetical protein
VCVCVCVSVCACGCVCVKGWRLALRRAYGRDGASGPYNFTSLAGAKPNTATEPQPPKQHGKQLSEQITGHPHRLSCDRVSANVSANVSASYSGSEVVVAVVAVVVAAAEAVSVVQW